VLNISETSATYTAHSVIFYFRHLIGGIMTVQDNAEPTTEKNSGKVSLLWGAVLGALLMAPMIAVFLIGEQLAGLPFVVTDNFDWIARNLPGGLITFGIDTMVDTLIALGFGAELDETAKVAEQMMGVGMFLGAGLLTGIGLFAFMNTRPARPVRNLPGLFVGLGLGVVIFALSNSVNFSSSVPVALSLIWVLMVMVAYGLLLIYAYNTLRDLPTSAESKAEGDVVGLNRRQFLVRFGGATATFTVLGSGLGALLSRDFTQSTTPVAAPLPTDPTLFVDGSGNPLPNADASVLPAPGTRREYTPVADHYRIDIVSGSLPEADEETYRLPITGLVNNPVEWSLEEIRAMPSISEFITMSCISNRIAGSLISTTKWTGVRMQYILDQIDPQEEAVALRITGMDGFDEYVSLDLIRNDDRVMLAYAFDDQPLPQRNGFPLRIHIPDRYGMKQPKWIDGIELVDELGAGYWVRRGWSAEAFVNTTSVIDTVAVEDIYEANDSWFVPIGGMAWSGDRGISQVQVRIDGGEWLDAELRTPMSDRSWTIWRYDWEFTEGRHEFEVRCVEGDGETPQIESPQPTRPDGATGLHSLRNGFTLPNPDDIVVETPTAS